MRKKLMLTITDQSDIIYYVQLADREYERMRELLADPDTEHNASALGEFLDATTRFVHYLNLINNIVLRERRCDSANEEKKEADHNNH